MKAGAKRLPVPARFAHVLPWATPLTIAMEFSCLFRLRSCATPTYAKGPATASRGGAFWSRFALMAIGIEVLLTFCCSFVPSYLIWLWHFATSIVLRITARALLCVIDAVLRGVWCWRQCRALLWFVNSGSSSILFSCLERTIRRSGSLCIL